MPREGSVRTLEGLVEGLATFKGIYRVSGGSGGVWVADPSSDGVSIIPPIGGSSPVSGFE